jgi:DNA-binding transcriptional regulator YiaG
MRVLEHSAADLCYKQFGSGTMSKEFLAWQQEMANRANDFGRDRGPYPSGQPAPTNAGPRPAAPNTAASRRVQPGEGLCAEQLRSTHTARFTAELLATLASRPSGWRIRNLRTVLGWNQRTAAAQLGISVRTLIRHEQGHHRTSSTRLALMLRLLELELNHANQILAYVDSRRDYAQVRPPLVPVYPVRSNC